VRYFSVWERKKELFEEAVLANCRLGEERCFGAEIPRDM